MAGKSTIAYWFRTEMREQLLKEDRLFVVADRIGIDKHYLSNIVNRNMPIKHKAIAYAITKCTGSDYEIEDVFEKKDIQ